jgi:hypothetical protein
VLIKAQPCCQGEREEPGERESQGTYSQTHGILCRNMLEVEREREWEEERCGAPGSQNNYADLNSSMQIIQAKKAIIYYKLAGPA